MATKPDNLSSIHSGIHSRSRQPIPSCCLLTSLCTLCVCMCMCAAIFWQHTQTKTHIHIKKEIKNSLKERKVGYKISD